MTVLKFKFLVEILQLSKSKVLSQIFLNFFLKILILNNSRRQAVQQNGVRGANPRAQAQVHNNVESSRFCHECGYEFPVQWARFCSYCGDKRL